MIAGALMGLLLMAPDEQPQPVERARANLGSYFSTDDYPVEALRRGSQGTVKFELQIDTSGRVSNCTVTDSSGDETLDQVTCSILRERTRYTPARDAEGRPTVGGDRGSVTWRLPDGGNSSDPPFVPMQLASTMHRSSAGVVTCTFVVNGRPTPVSGGNQCGMFQGSGAEQALQNLGVEAQLTQIFLILPAGGDRPAGPTPQGEIIFDTSAELELAADGEVTGCRVIEANYARRLPGLVGVPNLCGPYQSDPASRFQIDPSNPGPARGQVQSMLYLQIGRIVVDS